jgi:hypothetical protein
VAWSRYVTFPIAQGSAARRPHRVAFTAPQMFDLVAEVERFAARTASPWV